MVAQRHKHDNVFTSLNQRNTQYAIMHPESTSQTLFTQFGVSPRSLLHLSHFASLQVGLLLDLGLGPVASRQRSSVKQSSSTMAQGTKNSLVLVVSLVPILVGKVVNVGRTARAVLVLLWLRLVAWMCVSGLCSVFDTRDG